MQDGNNLTIKRSEQINDLVSALAKAQGEMRPATFNKVNPHFKTRYADFTSCMEAAREPVSKNGIAITQVPSTTNDGKYVLITLLSHTSGQWIAGEFPLIAAKMDSQGIGSAMTYAKRYSLCGMLGIVADEEMSADDDGESAAGRGKSAEPIAPKPLESEKIGKSEFVGINTLIQFLDEESKKSFLDWIKKSFGANTLQEIPLACFDKCIASLNAKIKYLNDKNKDNQQQMAVA